MLTIPDFLDLVAEHTACRCPAVTHASAPDNSDCPRNVAIRAHREASRFDGAWPIPQSIFAIDQIPAYLSEWDDAPRVVIAVLLWRATAEFVSDNSPLTVPPGQSISEAAEAYVRAHWREAERDDDATPRSIGRFLRDVALLGHYERLKQDQQTAAGPDLQAGLKTRRSFSIPGEAWYGATVRQQWGPLVHGQLTAGVDVLDEDGEPDGTGLGEWTLTWLKKHPQLDLELQVPVDAWKVFVQTEFPALLAELGVDDPAEPVPSIEKVSRTLLAAGWVDSTARAIEINDQRRPATGSEHQVRTR
ncbi:hypothetical protein AB0F43_31900 [Kribbella sp. NPDC023972]|uniref:hypothetical protein n=1 Tax=Kribbella sp. NPDC023972 TaxID=3154795 RepID=UPI0033DD3034